MSPARSPTLGLFCLFSFFLTSPAHAQAPAEEARAWTSPVTQATAAPDAADHDAEDGVADADREARALQLKDRADELFRTREYVRALELYERAHRIFPDARLLYNAGRSLQALGRYGDALQTFLEFQREAPEELRAQLHGFDALLEDLRGRVCEVRVGVNEPGATITLGSEVLGESPLSAPRFVNAGEVRLRVSKDGYFPVEKNVVLRGGGTASLDVVLESQARHGKLIVLSKVPGTTISVGDLVLGQAPTEVVLPPGTHRVLARKREHDDASTQVVLEAGQERTITLNPAAPALYERWWFWAGVGVVAAGTVVTILALQPSSPSYTDGDFTPSAISAPLVSF